MTRSEIVRQRLAGQYLIGPRARSAPEVVRALGAVQAQEYLDAKWALALRTKGVLESEVEHELNQGSILRTHVMRPTWHFVAAEDIRWLLELTGPRVHAVNAHPYRRLQLDDAVFRKSNRVIAKALSGGNHLTRSELGDSLERAGIDTRIDNRLAYLVMRAELDALICSGPRRGKQFTYALLDERVPPAAPLAREEALHRLALRYFGTRGPASAQDFSWWSGLTIADVKRAVDIAGELLEQVTIKGKTCWLIPSAGPLPRSAPSAHLLPPYDEYFIGFRDRSAMGEHVAEMNSALLGDTLMAHVVFVNGQVVGGWKRSIAPKRAVISLKLLKDISSTDQERIAVQARRFGRFLRLPVEIQP